MTNKYYVVEEEDGESWEFPSKNEALRFAEKIAKEGYVCIHVFENTDDTDGETLTSKMIK